jgi:hypothetical protein
VQWLVHRNSADAPPAGAIVVVGADEVDHRHIERLSVLCERRNIRLVLFFAHLREESLHTIGGGEVAFMRLANHQEAAQAAEFIGRHHKFMLSELTRALGGNETHSIADQEGYSVGESHGTGVTTGPGGGGQRSRSWSRTRNWSQTVSRATGTNWNDAAAAQRVYEFAVEPRVLQDLPDYALLLVKRDGRGSVVQAVECDPAIVTLPRTTMDPLPAIPMPHPAEAAVTAGPPSEVTISQPAPLLPHQVAPHQVTDTVLGGFGADAPGSGQPVSGPSAPHPPQHDRGWTQR